jgi:hypothetical protein
VFDAGFLLGLFFDPEPGGDIFLENVGCHFVLGGPVLKSRLGDRLIFIDNSIGHARPET